MPPTFCEVPIDLIDEPPDNPNHFDADRFALLVQAVQAHEDLQPPLLRPKEGGRFEVIDGVHRKRANAEVGRAAIFAGVVEVDDATAKALRIGLNRLRGELDLAHVARLLAEIQETGTAAALAVTGFHEAEIGELIAAASSAPDGFNFDLAGDPVPPPVAPPPKVRPFVLELRFATKADFDRARKGLRKAAGGRGKPLEEGLSNLLAGVKLWRNEASKRRPSSPQAGSFRRS